MVTQWKEKKAKMLDEGLIVKMRAMVKCYRNLMTEHLRVCPDPSNCVDVARLLGRMESWEIAAALVQAERPRLTVSLN